MSSGCRHFNHADIICGLDRHDSYCAGIRKLCDKDPVVCEHGVWQGCEVFCKHVGEVRDCSADSDMCDLPPSERPK